MPSRARVPSLPLSKGFCVSGARTARRTFEEHAEGAIFETDTEGKWGGDGMRILFEPNVAATLKVELAAR